MKSVPLLFFLAGLSVSLYGVPLGDDLSQVYTRALELKGEKQYLKSQNLLKQIIETNPNFTRAYYQLVKVSQASNDLASTERYFLTLHKRDEHNASMYFGLGAVGEEEYLHGKRQPEDSLAQYRRAIALNPSDPIIYTRFGDLSRRLRQLDRAEDLVKRLVKEYPQNAAAHFGRAYICQLQAKWDEALHHLESALVLNPKMLSAYYTRGLVYTLTGPVEKAQQIFETGEKLAEEMNDAEYRGDFKRGLGLTYLNTGDFERALTLYQQALKIYESIGNQEGEGDSLSKIGRAYREKGEFHEALKFCRRALAIHRAAYNQKGEADSLNGLGLLYHYLGDYQDSVNHLQQALRLYGLVGDREGEGSSFNNIANVYSILGEYQKALNYYEQGAKIQHAIGNRREELIALGNLGSLYQKLGQHQKAVGCYSESLQIAKSIGDRYSQGVLFGLLGDAHKDSGDRHRALEYYHQALELERKVGAKRGEAYVFISIGRAYLKWKEYPQAIDNFNKALEIAASINYDVLGLVNASLGRVYSEQGNYQQAFSHYYQAIKAIEDKRANLQLVVHKAGFLASRIKVYEEAASVLFKLNRREEAFHYAERARARAFLDLMAESKAEIRKKIDPSLREKEQLIVAKLSSLQKKIWDSEKPGADVEIKVVEEELVRTQENYDSLKLEIRRQSPEYAAVVYPEPVQLEQAQKLLDEKTVLLEYILGDEVSYLFAIAKARFEVYPLVKRAKIDPRVEKFHELLAQPPSDSRNLTYLVEAHTLYQWLVQPAERMLEGKQALIIVPDGNLSLLPFAALLIGPAEARGNIPFKTLPYLVKKYDLSFVQSASVLDSLKRNKNRGTTSKKELVVFADPIYEDERQGYMAQAAGNRRGAAGDSRPGDIPSMYRSGLRLGRIKYSGEEAERIAALYGEGATKYVREQATEERVKGTDLSQYRYVHFAVHGIVNPTRPEFSAIVLGSEGKEDGFLQLPEVFNLDLNADLVVLSACESGLGKQMRGEGLLGLTRGFMYAGARSVLAGLWQIVDSPATVEFMQTFYRQLAHKNKAAALRATQLEALQSQKYHHPFYWAAFILMGM